MNISSTNEFENQISLNVLFLAKVHIFVKYLVIIILLQKFTKLLCKHDIFMTSDFFHVI